MRTIEKVRVTYIVIDAKDETDAVERMNRGAHEPGPEYDFMEEIGVIEVGEIDGE